MNQPALKRHNSHLTTGPAPHTPKYISLTTSAQATTWLTPSGVYTGGTHYKASSATLFGLTSSYLLCVQKIAIHNTLSGCVVWGGAQSATPSTLPHLSAKHLVPRMPIAERLCRLLIFFCPLGSNVNDLNLFPHCKQRVKVVHNIR